MSNDQQLAVELDESRTNGRIWVQWSKSGMANVRVLMAGAAAPVSWAGAPIEDRIPGVEGILNRMRPSANGTEFHLKINRPGRAVAASAWNAATEPAELRELRRDLELMAHVPYVIAKAALMQGNGLEKAKSYVGAIASYRTGIEELATLYSGPDLLDDTGMKLVLAKSNEAKGNVETAAVLYGRVLDSRMRAYAAKHHLP